MSTTSAVGRLSKGIYLRRGIYWLRWTPVPGGPQERQSLGTGDPLKAIEEAKRLRLLEGPRKRQDASGCAAEVERYLDAQRRKKLSAETVASRGYVLHAFVQDLGVVSPLSISAPAVTRWHQGLAEKNPHTAEAYLKYVRWWLGWLVEQGVLVRNPAESIKPPKLPPRQRRSFMLPAQANALLAACKDPELKFAIYCGLHAGMRKDEIIEARTNWFDLDARLIHIQTTATFSPKDRDNRTVPITDEFGAFLQEFGLGVPFMFRPGERHGKPGTYRTDFSKAYNNLLDTCGLGEFTFHDLRRTFASLLVSKGVSIYKVAKWLGDTIEVVENTYGHLIPQDDEINASWRSARPVSS